MSLKRAQLPCPVVANKLAPRNSDKEDDTSDTESQESFFLLALSRNAMLRALTLEFSDPLLRTGPNLRA